MKLTLTTLLELLVIMALVAPASAAVITWDSPQDISGPGDVSTTGAVVEAIDLTSDNAGAGTTSVNGVDFSWDGSLMGLAGGSGLLGGSSTGDSGYDSLLNTVDHGDSAAVNPWPIQLGGGSLVNGSQYEVQLWYTDNRGFAGSFTMNYDDGNGNTVNLDSNNNGLGQYVLGTFTADGPNQTLEISGGGPPGEPHLSAYQVRLIPEPATMTLLGLGVLAVMLRRRSR